MLTTANALVSAKVLFASANRLVSGYVFEDTAAVTMRFNKNNMSKYKDIRGLFLMISVLSVFAVFIFYANGNSKLVLNVIESETVTVTKGIKLIVDCIDKPFDLEKFQDGSFWILKNYIRAQHGELNCGESITYTTHGDFTFLNNLPVLTPRWQAPISMALFAPGYDFNKTLDAIQYARNCIKGGSLIQYYVTFHIYFPNNHMPEHIPLTEFEALRWPYNCSVSPPYESVNQSTMYRFNHDLMYPINVGRNIARKAAITHLILASDIELYPSPRFVDQFLDMVIRNASVLYGTEPKVFPLVTFEIDKHATIPETKTALQAMILNKSAIPFHHKVCKNCHAVPNLTEWIAATETDELNVFTVGERRLKFKYWEPFYVSDNQEPMFDERVTWEGQKNKRIQGFAMCLLGYQFHVLNNAFLIHSPGIKAYKRDVEREKYVRPMNSMIAREIIPEYYILFGRRYGCYP